MADGVAVPAPEAEGAADPLAPPEPLGATEALGVGLGLGDGKMALGTLAYPSAKMSTKMTTTRSIQGLARLSVRGASAPR